MVALLPAAKSCGYALRLLYGVAKGLYDFTGSWCAYHGAKGEGLVFQMASGGFAVVLRGAVSSVGSLGH